MSIKKYDLIRFSRQLDVYSGVGVYFGFFKDKFIHYHLVYINKHFRELLTMNSFYAVHHNEQTKKV